MTLAEDRSQPPPSNPNPLTAEPTLAELFGELSEETKQLLRLESELARAEVRETVDHAKKAGMGFGAAGVLGYIAVLLLSFAAAYGLAAIMPTGFAFLIIGVIWAIGAAIAYLFGRRNLESIQVIPQRTMQSLKEDYRWLRHRIS